jgi:hypothetical protein
MPQAVSNWLPTAAARVRARVWPSRICGGQSGAGAGFLRVLRFPPPIFIPPNSPSSQSFGSVADVPSGPSSDSTLRYENRKLASVEPIRIVKRYSIEGERSCSAATHTRICRI